MCEINHTVDFFVHGIVQRCCLTLFDFFKSFCVLLFLLNTWDLHRSYTGCDFFIDWFLSIWQFFTTWGLEMLLFIWLIYWFILAVFNLFTHFIYCIIIDNVIILTYKLRLSSRTSHIKIIMWLKTKLVNIFNNCTLIISYFKILIN